MAKPKPEGQQDAGAPTAPVSLLDKIKAQVASLSPDQVAEQLTKLKAQKAKQKEYRTGSPSKPLTPEQLEKRKEYNKNRLANPEVKEKMKAYRTRPEVKEKMTAYRKARNERIKLLQARAKELGIE